MIVWYEGKKEVFPGLCEADPGLHRYVYLTKARYDALPWYLKYYAEPDEYLVVSRWYEALPKYNPEEYRLAKDNDWLPAVGKHLTLLPVQ